MAWTWSSNPYSRERLPLPSPHRKRRGRRPTGGHGASIWSSMVTWTPRAPQAAPPAPTPSSITNSTRSFFFSGRRDAMEGCCWPYLGAETAPPPPRLAGRSS